MTFRYPAGRDVSIASLEAAGVMQGTDPDSDVLHGVSLTVAPGETVALVGASANPVRPSYFVMQYLIDKGFEVVPVNPGLAGQTILGRPVHARLAEIEKYIDERDAKWAAEAQKAPDTS